MFFVIIYLEGPKHYQSLSFVMSTEGKEAENAIASLQSIERAITDQQSEAILEALQQIEGRVYTRPLEEVTNSPSQTALPQAWRWTNQDPSSNLFPPTNGNLFAHYIVYSHQNPFWNKRAKNEK